MREHNYKRIRVFRCAVEGCETTTENWYADRWMVTGSAQSDFRDVRGSKQVHVEKDGKLEWVTIWRDDRGILEDAGLIEPTDLAVALICTDHAPAMRAHLEELRSAQQNASSELNDEKTSRQEDLSGAAS